MLIKSDELLKVLKAKFGDAEGKVRLRRLAILVIGVAALAALAAAKAWLQD